jgi:hypothetical protein
MPNKSNIEAQERKVSLDFPSSMCARVYLTKSCFIRTVPIPREKPKVADYLDSVIRNHDTTLQVQSRPNDRRLSKPQQQQRSFPKALLSAHWAAKPWGNRVQDIGETDLRARRQISHIAVCQRYPHINLLGETPKDRQCLCFRRLMAAASFSIDYLETAARGFLRQAEIYPMQQSL